MAYRGSYVSQFAHYDKSASAEDVAGATPTAIGWDNEVHEDSIYTHDTVTNNSRVTVGRTGRYAITANVSCDNTETNKIWRGSCYLRVDGTTDKKQGIARAESPDGSGREFLSFNISTELDLTASQYIEVMVAQEYEDAAGTPTVNTLNGECELIIRCL
jgi:hypothetical protein